MGQIELGKIQFGVKKKKRNVSVLIRERVGARERSRGNVHVL